jgi:Domain of unknown function (DUF4365)
VLLFQIPDFLNKSGIWIYWELCLNGTESVRYPLNVKNYNDLRVTTFIPRLLIVVLVPENIGEWIQQSESEMLIKHCAYWVSLRGMPETRNTNRITVELLRRNQFTPDALESIMQRISTGGVP